MKQRNILCVVGAALVMVAFPCITAHAQESYSAAVKAGLHRDVTLHMGRTTIDAVVIALEKKTGLTIQMAKYLRGHKVQCDVEGISARSVLDAFVQMNHWRWYETTHPGTIALVGKAAGVPHTLTQLPQALRQCMNQDFVRILMAEPSYLSRSNPGIRISKAQAIKAGDRISAFVYQNALTSTDHRSISQLQRCSDHILQKYAQQFKPAAPSVTQGVDITPELVRAGYLGIMGSVFDTTATEDSDQLLCSSLPSIFFWLPETHIVQNGSGGNATYMTVLQIGHPNGNSYGTAGTLLNMDLRSAGYIP